MARERFSIATFNVRNLVNAETNYYQKPDGSWNRYSQAEFSRKIDWLAQQLIQMNADHICLQEIFHLEALQAVAARHTELIAERGLNHQPYVEVIHFANDRSKTDDPSPGLGYLGRTTAVSQRAVQDISADPITLGADFGLSYTLNATGRPIAIVEVDLGSGLTGFIVNSHLKSKRPLLPRGSAADDTANFLFLDRAKGSIGSLVLRAGEALALRREILSLTRGGTTPVFVAGDLNDESGAVTTGVVAGEAPWRFEPDFNVKKGFWDVELYSAARAHLRRSEHSDFTTHIYNGHHSTIDHIFVSQEFYYRNRDRVGDLDYVRAFNDHLVDGDTPGAPREKDATDHGQLVAHFSFVIPEQAED